MGEVVPAISERDVVALASTRWPQSRRCPPSFFWLLLSSAAPARSVSATLKATRRTKTRAYFLQRQEALR